MSGKKQPSVTLKDSEGTEENDAKGSATGLKADVNMTDNNAGHNECKDNAQEENGKPGDEIGGVDASSIMGVDGGSTSDNSKTKNGITVSDVCDSTHSGDDGGQEVGTS